MAKRQKPTDALNELLAVVSPEQLTDLIRQLTIGRPDVRRECFEFLKSQVQVSKALKGKSEGEIVLTLWSELLPDLDELDSYGGGSYTDEDHVFGLLDQIREQLNSKKVAAEYRQEILSQVLPFIKSGNAGMDDMLYEVAYAACYDNADLRGLAKAFEAMKDEWKVGRARDIYRRIRDRDKYLTLRHHSMTYGGDYHDLATFYWQSGEKEKALEVAEQGLRKGKGRMDELRRFVADRAEAAGDRDKYLALEFDQATDGLTLASYKAFKKLCTKAEWTQFEPEMLSRMKNAPDTEQMKIRLHRREHEEAVAILVEGQYPTWSWHDGEEIRIAKKLEKRYPEEILNYYRSGLGNLTVSATRKEYARKARVMAKVRHMLVEVLGDEARWIRYAEKVRKDNAKRPALQEEFVALVPGWSELK